MTAPVPCVRPQVCGTEARLPAALVPLVLRLETRPGAATEAHVTRDLRCTLQAHQTATHWGVILDLDGADTGSVWTCWTADQPQPQYVVVLEDCPDPRGCSEYAGHPGAHTRDLHDPLNGPANTPDDPTEGDRDAHPRTG